MSADERDQALSVLRDAVDRLVRTAGETGWISLFSQPFPAGQSHHGAG